MSKKSYLLTWLGTFTIGLDTDPYIVNKSPANFHPNDNLTIPRPKRINILLRSIDQLKKTNKHLHFRPLHMLGLDQNIKSIALEYFSFV